MGKNSTLNNKREPICVYESNAVGWQSTYKTLQETADGYGLGILHPSSCVVKQTTGGEFELTMVHPFDLEYRRHILLQVGRLIKVYMPITPTGTDDITWEDSIKAQWFRIYSIKTDDIKQTVTVSAQHISYDFSAAIFTQAWQNVTDEPLYNIINGTPSADDVGGPYAKGAKYEECFFDSVTGNSSISSKGGNIPVRIHWNDLNDTTQAKKKDVLYSG